MEMEIEYHKTKSGDIKSFVILGEVVIVDEKYLRSTSGLEFEKTGKAIYSTEICDESFNEWYQSVLDPVEFVCVAMSNTEDITCPNLKKILCNFMPILTTINCPNAEEVCCYNSPELVKIFAPNAIVYYHDTPKLDMSRVTAKQIIEKTE